MVGIEQGKQACAGFVALMVLVEKNEHKASGATVGDLLYEWDEKYGYLELTDTRCSLGNGHSTSRCCNAVIDDTTRGLTLMDSFSGLHNNQFLSQTIQTLHFSPFKNNSYIHPTPTREALWAKWLRNGCNEGSLVYTNTRPSTHHCLS